MKENKFKGIGNWAIKSKKGREVNQLILNSFSGGTEAEKINRFAWLYDTAGRIGTLEKGLDLYRRLFNDFVSFGIWLKHNNLVELNIKIEKKIKKDQNYFG